MVLRMSVLSGLPVGSLGFLGIVGGQGAEVTPANVHSSLVLILSQRHATGMILHPPTIMSLRRARK